MLNVSDYFDEKDFRSFEMRKFNVDYYYAVEPDCYNDGVTRSRLYVRGCDRIHFNGIRSIVPLYLAVWSEKNDPENSPCRSLLQEKYRALDIAYFVNFPNPSVTYEESNETWRIKERGEYHYLGKRENQAEDVRRFLDLGYAPSLVEWYTARLKAGKQNKSVNQLLTEKYY